MTQALAHDPAFRPFGSEIQRFANHNQRRLHDALAARELLLRADEDAGGEAPLHKTPKVIETAIAAIIRFALSQGHSASQLVGAYVLHHFLREQGALAERVLIASAQSNCRSEELRQAFFLTLSERKAWIQALLKACLKLSVGDLKARDYAAFNVGSLLDYEDVDLALVARTRIAQRRLDQGIRLVRSVFLRYASRIQLFLSEQISEDHAAPQLWQYEELLEPARSSVVSMTQLLSLDFLAGSPGLSLGLHHRVVEAHYAQTGNPITHEGFLRMALSELALLLKANGESFEIAPKQEVYIPSKLVVAALRVIHGVTEPQPALALAHLARKDPSRRTEYRHLEEALIESELLRTLMFVYVLPSDRFDLSDPAVVDNSRRVGEILGLAPGPKLGARLFEHYLALKAKALSAITILNRDIEAHLDDVSTFKRLLCRLSQTPSEPSEASALPLQLLAGLRAYHTGVFWDEVVRRIALEHAGSFARGLRRLSRARLQSTAKDYIQMMIHDVSALLDFFLYLLRSDGEYLPEHPGGVELTLVFWEALRQEFIDRPGKLKILVQGVNLDDDASRLYTVALQSPPQYLSELTNLIEAKVKSHRGQRTVRALRSMLILAHHRSHGVAHSIRRALKKHPALLRRLGSARRFEDLILAVKTPSSEQESPQAQLERLGDALDLSFVKGLLEEVLQVPSELSFVDAMDRYLPAALRLSFAILIERDPERFQGLDTDAFALFSTGGYGRREAFGGDWDYFAITERRDPESQLFWGRALQLVSAAMMRRGIYAHNRFSDHFGSYVMAFDELKTHLSTRGPETFIDEAELLEGRLLFGDPGLAQRFETEIRRPVYESSAHRFAEDVIREIKARRREYSYIQDNPKSAAGGLRELNLSLLAIRVVFGIQDTPNDDLASDPRLRALNCPACLRALLQHRRYLFRLREVYRLTVAYEDQIDARAFRRVGRDLKPLLDLGLTGDFAEALHERLEISAKAIDRTLLTLGQSLATGAARRD